MRSSSLLQNIRIRGWFIQLKPSPLDGFYALCFISAIPLPQGVRFPCDLLLRLWGRWPNFSSFHWLTTSLSGIPGSWLPCPFCWPEPEWQPKTCRGDSWFYAVLLMPIQFFPNRMNRLHKWGLVTCRSSGSIDFSVSTVLRRPTPWRLWFWSALTRHWNLWLELSSGHPPTWENIVRSSCQRRRGPAWGLCIAFWGVSYRRGCERCFPSKYYTHKIAKNWARFLKSHLLVFTASKAMKCR